jgi:hypothetical protein
MAKMRKHLAFVLAAAEAAGRLLTRDPMHRIEVKVKKKPLRGGLTPSLPLSWGSTETAKPGSPEIADLLRSLGQADPNVTLRGRIQAGVKNVRGKKKKLNAPPDTVTDNQAMRKLTGRDER